MAYLIIGPGEGWQPVADTSTTQRHRIGQKITGWDDTYGFGEFVYCVGVASTAAYDLCMYNLYTPSTTRAANTVRGPAGVAQSANVASQYGWYGIFGQFIVACDTTSANVALYIDGTTGRVDDAEVATDLIVGMRSLTADGTPAANQLIAQCCYPGAYALDTP